MGLSLAENYKPYNSDTLIWDGKKYQEVRKYEEPKQEYKPKHKQKHKNGKYQKKPRSLWAKQGRPRTKYKILGDRTLLEASTLTGKTETYLSDLMNQSVSKRRDELLQLGNGDLVLGFIKESQIVDSTRAMFEEIGTQLLKERRFAKFCREIGLKTGTMHNTYSKIKRGIPHKGVAGLALIQKFIEEYKKENK